MQHTVIQLSVTQSAQNMPRVSYTCPFQEEVRFVSELCLYVFMSNRLMIYFFLTYVVFYRLPTMEKGFNYIPPIFLIEVKSTFFGILVVFNV